VLVELGLVEQRYQAVREILDHGATVVDVARHNGVVRQTVHGWLRRYAAQGLAGLGDHASKPASCPHQMDPVVEARIVELRRSHSGRTRHGSPGGTSRSGPSPSAGAGGRLQTRALRR